MSTTDDDFLDRLDGRSETLCATRRGDLNRLAEIFENRPEAREEKGHMGRRPLHVAVELQNAELIDFLIKSGVEIDGARERGDTPLFWAPTAEIAKVLIRAGASIHTTDFAGREPIHRAAQFARPDVIDVFLNHGCTVDVTDGDGYTPLHWATGAPGFPGICEIEDPKALDCVELLTQRGANVNARGLDGNVPLHGVAVLPEMDSELLDGTRKYPPEIPETIVSIVQLLLKHGADPKLANEDGESPFSIACKTIRAEFKRFARKSR